MNGVSHVTRRSRDPVLYLCFLCEETDHAGEERESNKMEGKIVDCLLCRMGDLEKPLRDCSSGARKFPPAMSVI